MLFSFLLVSTLILFTPKYVFAKYVEEPVKNLLLQFFKNNSSGMIFIDSEESTEEEDTKPFFMALAYWKQKRAMEKKATQLEPPNIYEISHESLKSDIDLIPEMPIEDMNYDVKILPKVKVPDIRDKIISSVTYLSLGIFCMILLLLYVLHKFSLPKHHCYRV